MKIDKKISVDALHLAILFAFVRLGPEILWDGQWNEVLEVGYGTTLGYRRYTMNNDYLRSSRYVNLKTMDSLIMGRVTSVRDELNYLSHSGMIRRNVFAYYNEQQTPLPTPLPADSESSGIDTSSRASRSSNNSNSSSSGASNSDLSDDDGIATDFGDDSSRLPPAALELSAEDMDLIEILWKQDIDLGVSRAAYNSHECPEIEKSEEETLCSKVPDKIIVKKGADYEEGPSLLNEWEGYTIDGETGEPILRDQILNEEDQIITTEHSLFSADGFEELSPSLFPPDGHDCEDFNLTKISLDVNETSQGSLNNSFVPNLDVLFEQVEKLDTLRNEESGNNVEQYHQGSEMYPSMEEYWQDISTTLPLSVMGSAQQPIAPIATRPVYSFPEVSPDDHSTLPSSLMELLPRAATGGAFQGIFLQGAQRSYDISSSFQYLPPLLGPTSLGCAVASSIATLTNDTDPLPDMTGIINSTYGLDLPTLLHPNQTIGTHSGNDALLPDFLLNEDLQLMDVAAATPTSVSDSEVACGINKMSHDHMELSCDSVASSTSENMSSLSDCNDSRQAHVEELSSAEYNSKESLYSTLKYPTSHHSISGGYRQGESSSHSQKFGFNSPSYSGNYNNCLQHNHSYHLPFTNGNNSPRPVARDKSGSIKSDDESINRDEKRAKALKLPITICDIINLGIDEYNEKLTKFELTEPQLTLIRDIRRRGKNKVAAQNCRKRKMDQISGLQQTLDFLHTERSQLESERTQLLHERHNIGEKYSQLYDLVLQHVNSHPPLIPDAFPLVNNSSSNASFTGPPSTSEQEKDSFFNQGVRTKRKIEKKRLDFP